jgi:hypothetical protein
LALKPDLSGRKTRMDAGDRRWESVADGMGRFAQATLPIGGLGGVLRHG